MSHTIERAKSGRAKCRRCKEKIEKDDLRFGLAISGDFGDSFQWYHLPCAAEKVPVDLETTLEETGEDIPNRAELDATIEANRGKQKPSTLPWAELAPSGRSSCLVCAEKIPKGAPRVAIEREIDAGGITRTGAGYLHPQCVAGFDETPDNLADDLRANSISLTAAQIDAIVTAIEAGSA